MDWIKKKLRMFISTLMVALYNTEKTALNQKSGYMGEDVDNVQQMEQNNLLDDLMKGRVTMEVKTLRWRMYKVLEASANILARTDTSSNGKAEFEVSLIDRSRELKKVKTDGDDDHVLEMVIDNRAKPKEMHKTLDTDNIKTTDKEVNKIEGEEETKVLGEISAEDYFSHIKEEPKIIIERDHRPKFEIEKYAKKMNVKTIDDEYKMLEFYISKYPDEYDKKTKVLVGHIPKIDANPRASSMIEFNKVSFVTYKDLGVTDNLKYEFKDVHYIKTVEFDGYYVMKFGADASIYGESQVERYRMEDLDKRYEMKERRIENAADYTSFM